MRILSIPTNIDICYQDHNYKIVESYKDGDSVCVIPENLGAPSGAML